MANEAVEFMAKEKDDKDSYKDKSKTTNEFINNFKKYLEQMIN